MFYYFFESVEVDLFLILMVVYSGGVDFMLLFYVFVYYWDCYDFDVYVVYVYYGLSDNVDFWLVYCECECWFFDIFFMVNKVDIE